MIDEMRSSASLAEFSLKGSSSLLDWVWRHNNGRALIEKLRFPASLDKFSVKGGEKTLT